jgi:hypothetical protein
MIDALFQGRNTSRVSFAFLANGPLTRELE